MTRLFIDNPHLAVGHMIVLKRELHHKIKNVLRLKEKSQFIIFNNSSLEYCAEVVFFKSRETHVLIKDAREVEIQQGISIVLAQALIKGKKFDWVIQKAVELGVSEIVPLVTERCVIRDAKEAKKARWEKIIIHACQQSGRHFIPKLHEVTELQDFLDTQKSELSQKIILVEPDLSLESSTLKEGLSSFTVLIGPEGGLSRKEVLRVTEGGFMPVTLGSLTLRSETAPLALISIIQHRFGEFKF